MVIYPKFMLLFSFKTSLTLHNKSTLRLFCSQGTPSYISQQKCVSAVFYSLSATKHGQSLYIDKWFHNFQDHCYNCFLSLFYHSVTHSYTHTLRLLLLTLHQAQKANIWINCKNKKNQKNIFKIFTFI